MFDSAKYHERTGQTGETKPPDPLTDDEILQMAIEGICRDCKGSEVGCEDYENCDGIKDEIKEIEEEAQSG